MSAQNWLQLHFLNVDHGDCTIIRHPNDHRDGKEGRISFVDINDWKHRKPDKYDELVAGLNNYLEYSSSKSKDFVSPEDYAEKYLDDPIEYYNSEFGGIQSEIWRFISTHPDMDHLSGLARLDDEIGFDVLWDTNHKKEQDLDEEWPEEYSKEDWMRYTDIREGDTNHSSISPTPGSQKNYWDQDNIQILHPSPSFVSELNDQYEGEETQKYNDISYVLKITHNNQAILLPGDAEQDAWEEIIDEHGKGVLEDVTILKASHHGRENGFHQEAVEAMDPDHIILSVGKKPSTDAHEKYREVCSSDTEIWSTRQYGTINITCMRGSVSVSPTVPDGIFSVPN
ncbi:hydrolase [Natronomonas gomsonensis]|uniref:ComEC/Rec2 family competence protein n=1 Tax=Natronomonas gomsonensis TaxID=1046043 RepID=UPI0020CA5AA5|nr:hydrolase [Natronomonas gomsonensis]MCY4732472.1 hydrolase [Natronomonas gomsonensis]